MEWLINAELEHREGADRVLSVREEAHVSAIVEENSHGVIRQLVAEAVLVGVVHPFSHPLKTAAVWSLRNVIGWRARTEREREKED